MQVILKIVVKDLAGIYVKILSEQTASINANYKSGFILVLPQVPGEEGCVSSGFWLLEENSLSIALYVCSNPVKS